MDQAPFDSQSAPAAPVAEIVEIEAPSINSHADKIADWTARLAIASPDTRDEIFEGEIDPYREAGHLSSAEYNALMMAGE